MENTNKTTKPMTAEQLFAPIPSLAEVLNTGDMDIPPKSARNNETPFMNLEEHRIKSACKRDRDFQDSKAREFSTAHLIICAYYEGKIDFETAILQIMTECRRNRACAIMNIENSAQRFIVR